MLSLYHVDFGVLELYNWFATNTPSQAKSSRADIWCTRLQMALRICLVSIRNLGVGKTEYRLVELLLIRHAIDAVTVTA